MRVFVCIPRTIVIVITCFVYRSPEVTFKIKLMENEDMELHEYKMTTV
jgi:hypothetical protein